MSDADGSADRVRGWIDDARQAAADHREFAGAYKSISIATDDPALRSRMRKAAATSLRLAREAERRALALASDAKAGKWTAGAVTTINT